MPHVITVGCCFLLTSLRSKCGENTLAVITTEQLMFPTGLKSTWQFGDEAPSCEQSGCHWPRISGASVIKPSSRQLHACWNVTCPFVRGAERGRTTRGLSFKCCSWTSSPPAIVAAQQSSAVSERNGTRFTIKIMCFYVFQREKNTVRSAHRITS